MIEPEGLTHHDRQLSRPTITQSTARTVADLGIRPRPAHRTSGRHRHGTALVHRVRSAVRAGPTRRRRVVAPSVLRVPTRPSWLYRLTQGLHVGLGLILVPIVLAKLWSVIPKLFVFPPVRSPAQALERLSLIALVGGALFEIITGVLNIQYDYIFGFDFYTAHYWGAWVFIAGFVTHTILKVPLMVRSLRSRSFREVLRTSRADTRPEPPDENGLVAEDPTPPTISRRGALALVGGGAALVAVLSVGQTTGGSCAAPRYSSPAAARMATVPTTFRSTAPPRPRRSPRSRSATPGGSR